MYFGNYAGLYFGNYYGAFAQGITQLLGGGLSIYPHYANRKKDDIDWLEELIGKIEGAKPSEIIDTAKEIIKDVSIETPQIKAIAQAQDYQLERLLENIIDIQNEILLLRDYISEQQRIYTLMRNQEDEAVILLLLT